MSKGWRKQSARHSLAALGVRTKLNTSRRLTKGQKGYEAMRMHEKLSKYQNLADFITDEFGMLPVTVMYITSDEDTANYDPKLKPHIRRNLRLHTDYGQMQEWSRRVQITPHTSLHTFLHEMAHYLYPDHDEHTVETIDADRLKATVYRRWLNAKGMD